MWVAQPSTSDSDPLILNSHLVRYQSKIALQIGAAENLYGSCVVNSKKDRCTRSATTVCPI